MMIILDLTIINIALENIRAALLIDNQADLQMDSHPPTPSTSADCYCLAANSSTVSGRRRIFVSGALIFAFRIIAWRALEQPRKFGAGRSPGFGSGGLASGPGNRDRLRACVGRKDGLWPLSLLPDSSLLRHLRCGCLSGSSLASSGPGLSQLAPPRAGPIQWPIVDLRDNHRDVVGEQRRRKLRHWLKLQFGHSVQTNGQTSLVGLANQTGQAYTHLVRSTRREGGAT